MGSAPAGRVVSKFLTGMRLISGRAKTRAWGLAMCLSHSPMEGCMESVLSPWTLPGPAVCVKVYVWVGRESGEENLAAEIQGIH